MSLLALTVIAGWLFVLAGGFDLVLVSRLDRQVDDALRVRAQSASATVVTGHGQVTAVRESATDSELDSSIWVYAGTRAIERPNVDRRLRAAADSLAASSGYADRAGNRLYVLAVRVDGRRVGSVVAAIDLDPYERTRDTAVLGSVAVAVLLLAGAYPVLRFATGRALRPVEAMTQQAADWSVNAPGQRFGTDQTYDELRSLAVTMDELLDRMAAVLRHERHLSAELSHELRTPLARVTAEIELLLDDARPDQRADLLAVRDNCSSMDAIMDTLLAAARSELVGTVGRCDLGPVFAAIAGDGATPAVIAAPTTLAVGVDADMVQRILAPILANARRYAVTSIRLQARRVDVRIALDITNDGPRLPTQLVEQVFDPGFRADPDDAHDGAGLGLALARRLARSADGDLLVDPDAAQTTFRLLLPAG